MLNIKVSDNLKPDEITQWLQRKTEITVDQLKRISDTVKEGIEKNIESGSLWLGGAVSPLRPATIKRKGSARPLFESGRLLKSISNRKVTDNLYEVFVSVGRSEVASLLINGTQRMVARDFFGLTPEADKAIDRILEEEKQETLGNK